MQTIACHRHSLYRRACLLTLLIFATLLFAACNDDEEAAPSSSAAVAGGQDVAQSAQAGPAAVPAPSPTPFVPQGHLTLWHSWAGPEADALTEILTRVKAEAPLLSVETLYVGPSDLPQAMADAVHSGGGPDLAVTENWWITDLAAAEVIRPLTDLAQPTQLAEYWPAALDNSRRNGVDYALPATFETVGLYVNPALATSGQIPLTTDALLAQAQISPTLGLGLYANLFHTWWAFPAFGSELFDADGKVILDRNSGAADFLTWMKALSQTPGSFVDVDYGMLIDRFKKGEFAFFVDGPWAAEELKQSLGENLLVAPLPAGPQGPAQPWMSTESVVLNAGLDANQAALAHFLATRLTDAAAGSTFAQRAGRLPANRNASIPDNAIPRGFMQQAATAQPAPAAREMQHVWGYGGDLLVKVLGGSLAPGDAVRETTALINEESGR